MATAQEVLHHHALKHLGVSGDEYLAQWRTGLHRPTNDEHGTIKYMLDALARVRARIDQVNQLRDDMFARWDQTEQLPVTEDE